MTHAAVEQRRAPWRSSRIGQGGREAGRGGGGRGRGGRTRWEVGRERGRRDKDD